MNPWEIVSVLGAVCAGLVIVGITLVVLIELVKSQIGKPRGAEIMRGRRGE